MLKALLLEWFKTLFSYFLGRPPKPLPPEEPESWSPYPPVGFLERPSNQGWVSADTVVTYSDHIKIMGKFTKHTLPNTNSMEPWMDDGHVVLLKRTFNKNLLKVGDVAAYQIPGKWVLHSIVEVGEDEEGRWYRFQGINAPEPDPYLVRNKNITAVLAAIIYTKL